jgi:hypothetical protein
MRVMAPDDEPRRWLAIDSELRLIGDAALEKISGIELRVGRAGEMR